MARTAWMLLADLGHEVRTPLTGVLGMSELLLDGPLKPQQRRQVEAIRGAGEHLLRLVDDALDLACLGSGCMRLEQRPFDPRALLAGVIALHAAPAQARGLAFRVAVAPELPCAMLGDALRVRQVLFNLIGNAVKFTDRGEVGLHAGPGSGGRGLRLEVHDTGPGIDSAQQARLFRRFERAAPGTQPGSGLGLAISRELVLAMGGSIELDSAPGAGARFVVELPLPAA